MKTKIWKKSILTLVPLFLVVLSLANTAWAGSSANDMAITARVQEKLNSDSQLMGSSIIVDTKDGEVTLKGMVNSNADFTRAAKLASYVDGVKHVDNRLKTVKASSSSNYGGSSRASDCPVGANWAC
jgi:hypothetical protein